MPSAPENVHTCLRCAALRFGQWQQFMTTVYAGLGLA